MATVAPPQVSSDLPVQHSLVGNDRLAGAGGHREAVNPATGRAFARVSLLSAAQAEGAVASARAAFPAWSALSFEERGKRLMALRATLVAQADDVAALVAREQGKPAAEAHMAEIFPALEAIKHLARRAEDMLREEPAPPEVLLLAHKDSRLVYTPFGVVLAITPWNYPFSIALMSVATALAAGNTVVLKPAPATTLIGLRIGELFSQAGFPPGVVNVVSVDDAVAAALVEDPRVGKIVFTGSVATGRKVMIGAARNLTPVVLELGGKDAAVVCRDADLDRASRGIVWGAFVNAGQTCASVERVYVERPVAEEFLRRVVEQTRGLRQGDPAQGEVDVGPMTMERQRRIVEDHVADAVQRGARVLTGGQTPAGPGWFYPPTVLTGVDHTMRIMREETFGPVLPVMVVDSVDEAIRLANDSDYGLTASGWTRDTDTARRLQQELVAGAVTINDCVYSFGEPSAPWGGFKHSGIGRTHGVAGLKEMVQVKYVSRDTVKSPALWWYPYDRDMGVVASASAQAMHAPSFWTRMRNQLRLFATRRFRQRAHLPGIAANIDKAL
jgi:succinate-semialdehyde dehydrogenase/glutarate-semialdehyde dehydrogenase